MSESGFSGSANIQVGCCWIATPVARIASPAVVFAIEPDYLDIGITLDVFVILLHSPHPT